MKSKGSNEKPYNKIINQIFFKTVALMIISIIIVIFIRYASEGIIGNSVAKIISTIFGVDWSTATVLYYYYIRKYFYIIIIIIIVVIFSVFYKAFLSWFTKYFDEMIEGVNGIVNVKEEITMSPELYFMEEKLNQIKLELQKSANAERELEKRKNELIIYLAHDIKTPLTSVIGYLSLLHENPTMSAKRKSEYIGITLDKAYRLESLINEFFEITRYNLQSVPLNKESIDVGYMMVQIVDEANPQLMDHNKSILMNIPDELIICVDSEKMARVFNNILKNAISYSENNSVIEIYGYLKQDKVYINFKNAGVIAEDKLGCIFDKFYRIDKARQTSTGGAGLGLAISKDIVMLHGGDINVECNKTHTIFTVSIPVS